MFMDADGNRISMHRGPRTVAAFEESLTDVEAFLELREKAEAGDPEAQTKFLIRALKLGWFDFEEAKARRAKLTSVTDKQEAELRQLLIDADVRAQLDAAGRDGTKQREAGRRFVDMWREGRVPRGENELYAFWILIADQAETSKDKAMFAEVFGEFERSFGKDPRYGRALTRLERRLASFSD